LRKSPNTAAVFDPNQHPLPTHFEKICFFLVSERASKVTQQGGRTYLLAFRHAESFIVM
jgi:hypothetical protein